MLYPNGSTTRPTVSSPYGDRDPRIGVSNFHHGTDFIGFSTVRAVAAGKVTFAGLMNNAAGYTIVIDHGSGITSVYMHNHAHYARKGDRVTEGEPISVMGDSGNATGKCCHLEIRVNGTSIDPVPYIKARLTAAGAASTPSAPGKEYSMFIAVVRNKDWYLVVGGKACLLGSASGARDSGAPILQFADDWAVKQLQTVVTGIK